MELTAAVARICIVLKDVSDGDTDGGFFWKRALQNSIDFADELHAYGEGGFCD